MYFFLLKSLPFFGLVCRTALLALLTALLGGYFVIENPASSFICWHPDLVWMIGAMRRAGIRETHIALNESCNYPKWALNLASTCSEMGFRVIGSGNAKMIPWSEPCKVYKVVFYMQEFGSSTPKRTMLLTNARSVHRLSKVKGKGKAKLGETLCHKYLDKKGQRAFQGTPALKKSQSFRWISLYLIPRFCQVNPNSKGFWCSTRRLDCMLSLFNIEICFPLLVLWAEGYTLEVLLKHWWTSFPQTTSTQEAQGQGTLVKQFYRLIGGNSFELCFSSTMAKRFWIVSDKHLVL